MKKLLRPSGGHILDIDPAEVAEQFLSRAHNVNTRKGFPSRRGGRRQAYSGVATLDAYHLLNLELNSFDWWMLFGASTIQAVESSNAFDISFAGQHAIQDPHEWASTLLNGIPVFTNGRDPLLYWDGLGSSDALILPGWDAATTAKFVVAFRFHLFALNIDGPSGTFDNLLMWSDAADPGALPASWTPGAGNEAGSAIIADTPGRAIMGLPLGAQLMVYKPTSVYALEYAGQPPDNIFTVRPVNRSLGTLGPHCVREIGTKHLVVGNDDVVLTDGLNVASIAENRIKLALANTIDETYAQNSFVVRDLNKREVWVCVPESGSQFATIAHIWDERRDTWTTQDLTAVRYGTTGYVVDTVPSKIWNSVPGTWDSHGEAWNAGTVGSITRVVNAQASQLFVEDTPDTLSVTAQLAKYDLLLSDDDTAFTLIQRVYVRGTGLGFAAVTFRLGGRESPDDSITWSTSQPMTDAGVPVELLTRYVSIEINVTSDQPWTIDRIVFDYRPSGAFNGG